MVVESAENVWVCGWKDKEGEIQDVEKVQAANPASAKYRYVKNFLVPKYPKLAEYSISSLCAAVYAGTGKDSVNKRDLPDMPSFYKALKS